MRFLIPVALAFSLLGMTAMAAPMAPAPQSTAPATISKTISKSNSAAMPVSTKTVTPSASAKPMAPPAKVAAAPAAIRCRDSKGHFKACDTTAKKQTCRDAKDQFASCKN